MEPPFTMDNPFWILIALCAIIIGIPIAFFQIAFIGYLLYMLGYLIIVMRLPVLMLAWGGIVIVLPLLFIYNTLGFLVFRGGPLEPNPDISKVSGFYGPGTYWAWVLGMISVVTGTLFEDNTRRSTLRPSPDFLVCMVYAIASAIHFYQRSYALFLGKHELVQDAEIQATMHILYTAIPFFAVATAYKAAETQVIWLLAYLLGGGLAMPVIWGGDFRKMEWEKGSSEMRFQGCYAAWHLIILIIVNTLQEHYPRYIKLAPPLILVAHLGILEIGGRRPPSFSFSSSFTPYSGSSLSDMDQATSLASAAILLAYQWKLWRLPKRILRTLQRRLWLSSIQSGSLAAESRHRVD